MCHLLSGAIDKATGTKYYFGKLDSHSGIESGHSLKPDSYREFEWTKDDNGESLEVRTGPMDKHDSEWYKEKILSRFPSRQDIFNYISIIVCKSDKNNEIRYNDKGVIVSDDSWHDNGQKYVEIRYNDKGEWISYDSWYDNGQKCDEIRYNDKGECISYNRWYDNRQKYAEIRYNDKGECIS
jgi:hypothetical protein